MKHAVGLAITLLIFASGSSAPSRAQAPSAQDSDASEPAAMEALNKMGGYLRTLKDFEVKAAITSEDVLDVGSRVLFCMTGSRSRSMPVAWDITRPSTRRRPLLN
jgi:hypothetical protein